MRDSRLDEYREEWLRRAKDGVPSPWKRVPVSYPFEMPVAAGFVPATEWLVIVTHDGQTVVDATTGAILATDCYNDSEGDDGAHDDPDRIRRAAEDGWHPISVAGIGPIAGQRIPVAGLWGGGLRTCTRDGWAIRRIAPNWPDEGIVLEAPSDTRHDPSRGFLLLKDWPEFRAFGFSDSGRSLVVASHFVFVWTRD